MSPLFPPSTSLFGFGLLFLGDSFWLLSFSWILLPGIFSSSLFPFPGVLATRMPLSSLFWVSVPFFHSKPLEFIVVSPSCMTLIICGLSVGICPLCCFSGLTCLRRAPNYLFSVKPYCPVLVILNPFLVLLFSSVYTTLFHIYGNPRRAPRVPVPQEKLSERHYWSLCLCTLPACIPAHFPTWFLSFWSKMSRRHRPFLVSPSLDMSTNRKANTGHTLIHNSLII